MTDRANPRLRRWRDEILWCLLLTVAMEAVTCFLRFGADYQTTRDTSFLARFTFGLRIHHGYLGLLILLVLPIFRRDRWLWKWAFRIGVALVFSDLIHHFLVLWPITGDPAFHLLYPQPELTMHYRPHTVRPGSLGGVTG